MDLKVIVTLVDKHGGVLVSGSDTPCDVCLRLIEVHGTAEYVSAEFCNCKIKSDSESKLKTADRYYLKSRQTTMTFEPWEYIQSLRESAGPAGAFYGPDDERVQRSARSRGGNVFVLPPTVSD